MTIREESKRYLESLTFYYYPDEGVVMCQCGNIYEFEDDAENHWFEEHSNAYLLVQQ